MSCPATRRSPTADKNGDTILCVKDVPDTSGHLGPLVFNVVDNTANH